MYSGSSCTTRGCKRLPDDGAIDYHDPAEQPGHGRGRADGLRERRAQHVAQLGLRVVTAVSDLRILHVELETDDDHAEYSLLAALDHLVETVAAGTTGGYRIVITEVRQQLLHAERGAADRPNASLSSAQRGAS
jgi:hypothetical protein